MQLAQKCWDVIVLGGGVAGCAAAAEAVAEGASALIVERRPVTGWEMTWAHAPEFSAGSGRFYAALREKLEVSGALLEGRVDPATATVTLDEVLEDLGVQQLLYAQPLRLVTDGGRALAVAVATKSGQQVLRAKAFIDATETGLFWGSPSSAPPARSRFSTYLWTPDNQVPRVGFGEAGPAQYIKLRPGAFSNSLELAFELDAATIIDARLALPEVLKKVRESGDLPAEAIVTHTAPELLPISVDRQVGSPGEPHPETSNLFGAGQWLIGYSMPEEVCAELSAWGSRAGASAVAAAASIPEPGAVSVPTQVAPPHCECEILIAGAGTAGALAGIAAARRGKKTVLIEAGSAPGGIGTSGGIHMYYCGIKGGLQDEVDARVAELAPLFAPADACRGYHPEAKKAVLEAMLAESGAEVHYGEMLVGAVSEEQAGLARAGDESVRVLTEAIVASAAGGASWKAKVFIDSTGDADLACWAGAKSIFGRESDGLPHAYSLSSGRVRESKMQIVNFDAGYVDPSDSEDLTRAQRAGLAIYRAEKYTDEERPSYIAPLLGLRSSRQVICDYQVTFSDEIRAAHFDDAVAECFSHYDNHGFDYSMDSDEAMFWVWVLGHWSRRTGCQVPYRSLLPQGVEGLIIACRALGVTYDAAMMLRMQNDMQRLGEVAGIAAVMAVDSGTSPRGVDTVKLRAELVASGAMRAPGQESSLAELWTETFGSRKALPAPEQANALIAELQGERASEALLALATAEGASESMLAELQQATGSDVPAVRFRASAALAMQGQAGAVPGLLAALRERQDTTPDPECRAMKNKTPAWIPAIVLLGRLGATEAVPELSAVLEDGALPLDAHLAAVRALGRIGDAAAVPALESCLGRSGEKLERNLQSSSGGLHSPAQDARWQLELSAVEALLTMGTSRPDVVKRHLADERMLVRNYAERLERKMKAIG
jgi:FAD dependent oxidoreductase/PBS lyase HEAT-like repeat